LLKTRCFVKAFTHTLLLIKFFIPVSKQQVDLQRVTNFKTKIFILLLPSSLKQLDQLELTEAFLRKWAGRF